MRIYSEKVAFMTRAEAKALLAFASKDETRMGLNGVLVDWAGGAMVAMDGHRLAKVNGAPERPDAGETLIPRAALESAFKLCRKPGHGIRVERNELGATLRAVDFGSMDASEVCAPDQAPEDFGPFQLGAVDARSFKGVQFPPYRQVVPAKDAEREPAKAVGFNARYLGDCALASEAAGCSNGKIKLCLGGELDPAVIEVNGTEGSWTLVVMPMRI